MEQETKFKIEKGIPIPARRSNNTKLKYLIFREMEVGDSVYFPEYSAANMKKYSNNARHFGGRCHPVRKFVFRKQGDGFRIWRVE